MTVVAGLPGAEAFAAFYSRFVDAIRAGGLRTFERSWRVGRVRCHCPRVRPRQPPDGVTLSEGGGYRPTVFRAQKLRRMAQHACITTVQCG